MKQDQPDIDQLRREAVAALNKISSGKELEEWRVAFIGRKGSVPQLLRRVKDLPAEEKKRIGKLANELRRDLEHAYRDKKESFHIAGAGQQTTGDISIADASNIKGHLHPITLTIRRVCEILASLGFVIVEGPEVEQEYYDFDALNIPLEHPARAESDSFYIEPRKKPGDGLVLRTSTSAVQVRSVSENHLLPPFRIASPGRVFRNEKPDATHESMFHQIEALMVGSNVTIADYRAVTERLFTEFFGREAKIRLRPGYFPFVEPGFEVDMSCVFCEQQGCRICKNSGWIEMGGAGMVHPNVLKNMNIDANRWQGFAFGYGIDRFTMLRHNINDIRLFWSGDLRFLKQFS